MRYTELDRLRIFREFADRSSRIALMRPDEALDRCGDIIQAAAGICTQHQESETEADEHAAFLEAWNKSRQEPLPPTLHDVRLFIGEVVLKMQESFPDAKVYVERFIDPEATTPEQKLFVVAKIHGSGDDVMVAQNRIDNEWWLNNRKRGHGLVQIAVEAA